MSSDTFTFSAAELAAHEIGALGGLRDLWARVDRRAEVLQLTGQRLGAATAGVHDDQNRAVREVGGRGLDECHRLLPRLGGGLQHDHALVGEQRRTQQFGQFGCADLTGAHAVHRDIVDACLLADGTQDSCDGPLDEQFLVPEDQMQAGDRFAHVPIVPCRDDSRYIAPRVAAVVGTTARQSRS